MPTVFVDTNIFLQCRSMDELPWDEVVKGEIQILVSSPVQEEVDYLKHDGNSRRARRARKASGQFRKMLLAENEETYVEHKRGDSIRMALAPSLRPEDPKGILDLSRADDRIVGEALAFAMSFPDEETILVSNDVNICLTAKRCRLSYFLAPDSWLLPAEPDERDKTINRLESEVSRLSGLRPSLKIDVIPTEEEDRRVDLVEYEPLSEDRIGELRDEVAANFPMQEDFGGRSSVISAMSYRPPSDSSIQKYQDEEYPKWLGKVEDFFRAYSSALGQRTRCIEVEFRLRNNGGAPAEYVVVEVCALGGLLFAPPDEHFEVPICPAPPAPPRRRSIVESLQRLHSDNLHLNYMAMADLERPRRDRFGFYWRDSKPSSFCTEWAFECEELRHHEKPEDFLVTVYVPESYPNSRGAIEFRVSARNLATPLREIVPITITRSLRSADLRLKELLSRMKEDGE